MRKVMKAQVPILAFKGRARNCKVVKASVRLTHNAKRSLSYISSVSRFHFVTSKYALVCANREIEKFNATIIYPILQIIFEKIKFIYEINLIFFLIKIKGENRLNHCCIEFFHYNICIFSL